MPLCRKRPPLDFSTRSRYLSGAHPPDYVVPSPTPAIRYRPIAKMDARYLCPVPSNLCWALKEQFEAALKTRTDWESYQKHRADFLVPSPHAAAAAEVQKRLDAWKATVHYDVADMNEGEFIGIVRDLKSVPAARGNTSEAEFLKSYVAMKEKERATWADQAQLKVGGQQ